MWCGKRDVGLVLKQVDFLSHKKTYENYNAHLGRLPTLSFLKGRQFILGLRWVLQEFFEVKKNLLWKRQASSTRAYRQTSTYYM